MSLFNSNDPAASKVEQYVANQGLDVGDLMQKTLKCVMQNGGDTQKAFYSLCKNEAFPSPEEAMNKLQEIIGR